MWFDRCFGMAQRGLLLPTFVGKTSGADGVLNTGVLTPTSSPNWVPGALIGRQIRLGTTNWYDVTDNTATTATIASPPANATYAYLVDWTLIDDALIASS